MANDIKISIKVNPLDINYNNFKTYHLIISCPQNKAMNVPIIKNGAKGTSLLSPFFLKTINPF